MKEAFEKIIKLLEVQERQYHRRAKEHENINMTVQISDKFYGKACSYNHAISIVNQVAEEFGNDFCEWFKYDYRTIAPKNHDVGNPYWRIPEDYSKLMFCPYCGKKIKVVK